MDAVSSVSSSVSIIDYAPSESARRVNESPPPPQSSQKESMTSDEATGQHVNVVA